jgi:hypothetical protein
MASDDDVEMVDATLPRFSTAEKGKGKAAGPALPEEDNGLPWYDVSSFLCFIDPLRPSASRVEKYRPVTMDDVVSHQDIISTSTFFPSSVGYTAHPGLCPS